MQVANLMVGNVLSSYYDPNFRKVLEDHMTYLRLNSRQRSIEPGLAHRYENDFYGLLVYLGIPHEYHWLVMRMAGLNAPEEATGALRAILLPDEQRVERLRSYYNTTKRVS